MQTERSVKQQKMIRIFIWRFMDQNQTNFGFSEKEIAFLLKVIGIDAAKFGGKAAFESQISEAIRYFAEKGLIENVSKAISKENCRWRISMAGNNH